MWITKEEYANYLKEMEPEVYEKLKSEGRLESYLELKMKQAKRHFKLMMDLYRTKNPEPPEMTEEEAVNYLGEQRRYGIQETNRMLFGQETMWKPTKKPTTEKVVAESITDSPWMRIIRKYYENPGNYPTDPTDDTNPALERAVAEVEAEIQAERRA